MFRIRIEIIAMIDRTAEFGSKKSIKTRFEYDLERNLAQGRSNRISLQGMHSAVCLVKPVGHPKTN